MTKCCSSSSTRPRNCGSSRCCTRSRWRARLVRDDRFAEAYKALSRVSRIQAVMTMSWDVLATMTPVDYAAFRDVLGPLVGLPVGAVPRARISARDQGSQVSRVSRRRRRGTGAPACRARRAVACGTKPMPRSPAPASTSADERRDPRLVARRLSRPRHAISTSTNWPRNWSISTMRWPAGGTSMC